MSRTSNVKDVCAGVHPHVQDAQLDSLLLPKTQDVAANVWAQDGSTSKAVTQHANNEDVENATQMAFQATAAGNAAGMKPQNNIRVTLRQPDVHPLLNDLVISEFNRSCKFPPDNFIESFAFNKISPN